MTVRLAINGFGRIGRCLLRALVESSATKRESDDITLVAINELADLPTMAYLTKFDSTHGRFPGEVKQLGSHALGANGREVRQPYRGTVTIAMESAGGGFGSRMHRHVYKP